jgi:hypothetical protein
MSVIYQKEYQMSNLKKVASNGASAKPDDVIFLLFPEELPPDRNVVFLVWFLEEIALKVTAEQMGVLSKTFEAFPEPKLTPRGLTRGIDRNYYCVINLMSAEGYAEIRKAAATIQSIIRQIFGIQPNLSSYAGIASLRIFEKQTGITVDPSPTQNRSGYPTTIH